MSVLRFLSYGKFEIQLNEKQRHTYGADQAIEDPRNTAD